MLKTAMEPEENGLQAVRSWDVERDDLNLAAAAAVASSGCCSWLHEAVIQQAATVE